MKSLDDEILKQISLIKYDRNKTLLENTNIIFEAEKNVMWCNVDEDASVKNSLIEGPLNLNSPFYINKDGKFDKNPNYKQVDMSSTCPFGYVELSKDEIQSNYGIIKPWTDTRRGDRAYVTLNNGTICKKYNLGDVGLSDEAKDQMVADYHAFAPLASLALVFVAPPFGMLIGAGLELIDSGLYYNYDKDPYMGTISLIFAIVPLKMLHAVPGIKLGAKETALLIRKVRSGVAYNTLKMSEKESLRAILRNKQAANFTLQIIYKGIVKEYIKKQGPKGIFKLLEAIKRKGWLLVGGHLHFVNVLGSVHIFDYFASKYMGECKGNMQISGLVNLVYWLFGNEISNIKYDKDGFPTNINPNTVRQVLINSIDWAVQPWTKSQHQCDLLEAYNLGLVLMQYKNAIKLQCRSAIDSLIKNNKSSGLIYNLNIHIIQNILKVFFNQKLFHMRTPKIKIKDYKKLNDTGKYSFNLVVYNFDLVKTFDLYSITGTKIIQTMESGKSKDESDIPFFENFGITTDYGVLIVKFIMRDGTEYTNKIMPEHEVMDVPLELGLIPFPEFKKYGYYNDDMKAVVKSYQDDNGLEVTGLLDSNTLNKIKSQMTMDIENITGFSSKGVDIQKHLDEDVAGLTALLEEQSKKTSEDADNHMDSIVFTPKQKEKMAYIVDKYAPIPKDVPLDTLVLDLDLN